MKKKIGSWAKVTEEYSTVEHGQLNLEVAKQLIMEGLRKAVPKGWIPLTPIKYCSGHEGNDFILNIITVTGQRFIVKAPRILSKKYHKK